MFLLKLTIVLDPLEPWAMFSSEIWITALGIWYVAAREGGPPLLACPASTQGSPGRCEGKEAEAGPARRSGHLVGAAQDGLASAPLPLHGPHSHMPCQQQQRGRVSALSHFSAGSGKESWGHQ